MHTYTYCQLLRLSKLPLHMFIPDKFVSYIYIRHNKTCPFTSNESCIEVDWLWNSRSSIVVPMNNHTIYSGIKWIYSLSTIGPRQWMCCICIYSDTQFIMSISGAAVACRDFSSLFCVIQQIPQIKSEHECTVIINWPDMRWN